MEPTSVLAMSLHVVSSFRLHGRFETFGYLGHYEKLIIVCIGYQCSFLSSAYGWRWGAFHEVRVDKLWGTQLPMLIPFAQKIVFRV